MVALASPTTENSHRCATQRFEKPLSRVRGNSAMPSCRVRSFNSLNRIEIGLSIYESSDRLESFSRDPIGYEGSEWNLYEYCHNSPLANVDPDGELYVAVACTMACLGGIGCAAPCLSVCGADPACLLECYSNMGTYGKVVCGGAVLGCAACLCYAAGPACGAPLLACIKNPKKCRPPKKPPKKVQGCMPCAPSIMYTNPIGPPGEQCPETCLLRRATLTPPCSCYYSCPSMLGLPLVKLPNFPL